MLTTAGKGAGEAIGPLVTEPLVLLPRGAPETERANVPVLIGPVPAAAAEITVVEHTEVAVSPRETGAVPPVVG